MTSSASKRFVGSYVIDESFLNDVSDLFDEAIDFNQSELEAKVKSEASLSRYDTQKEKQAAVAKTTEFYSQFYTQMKVTCCLKNGITRKDIQLSSLMGANKIDERGIESIELEIGSQNCRSIRIVVSNFYSPIRYTILGDYSWVDYTSKRFDNLILKKKQIWSIFSSPVFLWFWISLSLPYAFFSIALLISAGTPKFLGPFILSAANLYLATMIKNVEIILITSMALILGFIFFEKKISNFWARVFPVVTFSFGEAKSEAKKFERIRAGLIFYPITNLILPFVLDKFQ